MSEVHATGQAGIGGTERAFHWLLRNRTKAYPRPPYPYQRCVAAAVSELLNTRKPPVWHVERQKASAPDDTTGALALQPKHKTYQRSGGGFASDPQRSAENRGDRRYDQHLWVQDPELRSFSERVSFFMGFTRDVWREELGGVRWVEGIQGGRGSKRRLRGLPSAFVAYSCRVFF